MAGSRPCRLRRAAPAPRVSSTSRRHPICRVARCRVVAIVPLRPWLAVESSYARTVQSRPICSPICPPRSGWSSSRERARGVRALVRGARSQSRTAHLRRMHVDRRGRVLALATGVDGLMAKGHEAGGFVGEETTFILIQRLLADTSVPVWAYGGIGLHAPRLLRVAGLCGCRAGCAVRAGAGVDVSVRTSRPRCDGWKGTRRICLGIESRRSATACIAAREWPPSRRCSGWSASLLTAVRSEARARWRAAIRERIGWDRPEVEVWPLGQDAAFAAPLASRFHTVAGIVGGLAECGREPRRAGAVAKRARSRCAAGPRSRDRISDPAGTDDARQRHRRVRRGRARRAGRCRFWRSRCCEARRCSTLARRNPRAGSATARGASASSDSCRPSCARSSSRSSQRIRPPFAIIAGGRPDQADTARSPRHRDLPARAGAWPAEDVPRGRRAPLHLRGARMRRPRRAAHQLRALGIDDRCAARRRSMRAFRPANCTSSSPAAFTMRARPRWWPPWRRRSSSAASASACCSAPRTSSREEAVEGDAIVENFQREALECTRHGAARNRSRPRDPLRRDAVLRDLPDKPSVDSSPRAVVRRDARGAREPQPGPAADRVARAIVRDSRRREAPARTRYVRRRSDAAAQDGMYMIGQVAALRADVCTMADLHDSVSVEQRAAAARRRAAGRDAPAAVAAAAAEPCDIAIIGMGCLLPKAPDVQTFWANVLNKVDAISEVPKDRFDIDLYFDADRKARRQDLFALGRVPRRCAVRSAALRHSAGVAAVDRSFPAAVARSGASGAGRCGLSR